MKNENEQLPLVVLVIVLSIFTFSAGAEDRNQPIYGASEVSSTKNTLSWMKLLRKGDVKDDCYCPGFACLAVNDKCCDGCYCVPIFFWTGICVGSCC